MARGLGLVRNAVLRRELASIAVGERMIGADLLPIEASASPDSREPYRLLEVLVHAPGEISHRLAPAQREWWSLVRRTVRGLGVCPHDAEMVEQPRRDFAQTVPGSGRD